MQEMYTRRWARVITSSNRSVAVLLTVPEAVHHADPGGFVSCLLGDSFDGDLLGFLCFFHLHRSAT